MQLWKPEKFEPPQNRLLYRAFKHETVKRGEVVSERAKNTQELIQENLGLKEEYELFAGNSLDSRILQEYINLQRKKTPATPPA